MGTAWGSRPVGLYGNERFCIGSKWHLGKMGAGEMGSEGSGH